jgi:hypothetical protein
LIASAGRGRKCGESSAPGLRRKDNRGSTTDNRKHPQIDVIDGIGGVFADVAVGELEMKIKRERNVEWNAYIWSHWLVDWTPPNVLLRALLLDDTLVERGATSFRSRVCGESTC